MKRSTFVRGALALSGLLLSAPLWAQAPDDAPPPMAQGGGGPGGGFGRGPGGFGGRGGGNRGNIAFGVVSAVDASANTITVTPRGGGADQVIQVPSTASLITQTTTTISNLRVGEQVRVSGIPTTITASQIVVGTLPATLTGPGGGGPGGRFGGGPGGFGGGRPGGQGGGFGGGRPGGPGGGAPGTMSISASVLSLNPLTLVTPENTNITLKMAPDAKIGRISTIAVSAVKVGDQIIAQGQTGTDGMFTATTVADNLDLGQGQGGGRGGFGGGPGGYGGGQRGGRRQRGGPNGGQPPADGNMAPPPTDG